MTFQICAGCWEAPGFSRARAPTPHKNILSPRWGSVICRSDPRLAPWASF